MTQPEIVDPVAAYLEEVGAEPEGELVATQPTPPDLQPRTCPEGHQSPHDARFCAHCGARLDEPEPQPWTCGRGTQNEAAFKFCPCCGAERPHAGSNFAAVVAAAARPDPRPKPYHLLTPEERAERDRQHAEAVRMGSAEPALTWEHAGPGQQTYLIHFLEDGLSFAGQVWYRGQEIELAVGSERWEQAKHWITMDDFAQVDRWGKVMFRKGPWPGKSYLEAAGQFQRLKAIGSNGEVAGPTEEELARAEEMERRRRRAVPAPVFR